MMWRIAFGILVLLMAFVPMFATWMLMLSAAASLEPPSSPALTPNPTQVPDSRPGPLEILVFADPWFAGAISYWLMAWLPAFVVYAIVSTVVVCRPADQTVSRFRRP